MGARNAIAAYQRWAGKVPGASMQLLVFMALVAKDGDDWPWYGQGQAALAEHAMGRENPDRTDLRAVSRAMTALLDAGAVTVERAATHRSDGNSTARYRLNLHDRADAARSGWEQSHDGKGRMADPRRKREPYDGNRPMDTRPQDQSHTTFSGKAIRRKVASHTTKTVVLRMKRTTRGARKPRKKILGLVRTSPLRARTPRPKNTPKCSRFSPVRCRSRRSSPHHPADDSAAPSRPSPKPPPTAKPAAGRTEPPHERPARTARTCRARRPRDHRRRPQRP